MRRDNWRYICIRIPSEAKRMRHCRGCVYMGACGDHACCNYFLTTGIRRPSKFGQPCPVKKVRPGYTPPKGWAEYVERMDREEEEERRKAEEKERLEAERKKHGVKEQKKIRGPKPNWDRDYAFMLYCKGYYLFEIAEICGVTHEKINNASSKYGWRYQRPEVKLKRHGDLTAERQAYLDYMSELEKWRAENV